MLQKQSNSWQREKEPDIVWHNSNLKCDCMEPSFKSKRTKCQILMLQLMTFPPHCLPNAAQKAICWMFGASWMVASGENMQVWTSNTGGVMKFQWKFNIKEGLKPQWFVDGSREGINSRWCPFSNVVKFGNQLHIDSFHSLWLKLSSTTVTTRTE